MTRSIARRSRNSPGWAGQAPCVPVYRQLTGDGLTPVSAFRQDRAAAPSFLFESVIGGEKVGRFSFLGTEPFLRFEARGTRSPSPRPIDPDADPDRSPRDDPFRDLRSAARAVPGRPPAGPAPVRRRRRRLRGLRRRPLHRAPARRPARRPRPARPLVRLLRPDGHLRPHPQDDPGRRPRPPRPGRRPASGLRRRPAPGSTSWSTGWPSPAPSSALDDIDTDGPVDARCRSRTSPASEYEAVVRHCQEYIKAGDIFQVVPSQRFQVETTAEPFDIYRVLRVVNPSPFLFYLTVRRLPPDRQLARDPGAGRGRHGDDPPAGRHPPARQGRGRGPRPGRGAAGRPQGAGRAHHARRPRPQRRRPRGRLRRRCSSPT